MKAAPSKTPFDGKRMFWGGFETIIGLLSDHLAGQQRLIVVCHNVDRNLTESRVCAS